MSGRRSVPRSCWGPITRSPASAMPGPSMSSIPRWRSRASIPTRTASTRRRSSQPLAKVNVESLKEFDYFTFVHFDGEDDKLIKLKPPVDYWIDYDKSVLTLHFTLAAGEAGRYARQAGRGRCLRSFLLRRLRLRHREAGHACGRPTPKAASAKVKVPDPETAADTKALTESFFTQLGPNSNFGSQFAQTVTVKCKDSHL